MSKDQKSVRFGVMAVKLGFLSSDQLVHALEVQVQENLTKGEHRMIGMILLEQGRLTLDQVNEILLALDKKRKASS